MIFGQTDISTAFQTPRSRARRDALSGSQRCDPLPGTRYREPYGSPNYPIETVTVIDNSALSRRRRCCGTELNSSVPKARVASAVVGAATGSAVREGRGVPWAISVMVGPGVASQDAVSEDSAPGAAEAEGVAVEAESPRSVPRRIPERPPVAAPSWSPARRADGVCKEYWSRRPSLELRPASGWAAQDPGGYPQSGWSPD